VDWGLVLKAYRAKHNLFQKDLALKLNISKAQLSKIESGIHEPMGGFVMGALKLLIPSLENEIMLLEIESEHKGGLNVSAKRVKGSQAS
jgi:transcriptional regulator with XRE-family HTH domain